MELLLGCGAQHTQDATRRKQRGPEPFSKPAKRFATLDGMCLGDALQIRLCRKVAFWRQNPKMGYRKINDLRASTFLFSVICDRAEKTTGRANRAVSEHALPVSRLRCPAQGQKLYQSLVPHAVWDLQTAQSRLFHRTCRRRKTTSFRPLSALLTASVAPELLFIEAKWSSLASYGLTVKALKDFLPLDATLAINTVRHDTLKVAERLEAELGEEQRSFIEGCPRDWAQLPIPDGPITVGIDGGYVRDWDAKKRNCEVIVGKSTLAFKRDDDEDTPSSKRFGFVINGVSLS